MKTFLFVLLLCGTVLGGTVRHDVSEKSVLDFGAKFYCTKKVVTVKENHDDDGTLLGVGTCIILNEHWIITCGHLSEVPMDYMKVIIAGKEHCIDKFYVNKDFSAKNLCGDIALGYSEKGFGKLENTPVIYRKRVKIGDVISFAGYGRFGTMSTGASKFDYKLRGGTNRISGRFKKDLLVIDGSNNSTKTSLEYLPNVGDSGGGMFVNGELAGITSCVLSKDGKADSDYGDEGCFTEIYPYLEWIDEHVKKTEM